MHKIKKESLQILTCILGLLFIIIIIIIIIIITIIIIIIMSQCCGIKQYTQTEKLKQIGQI